MRIVDANNGDIHADIGNNDAFARGIFIIIHNNGILIQVMCINTAIIAQITCISSENASILHSLNNQVAGPFVVEDSSNTIGDGCPRERASGRGSTVAATSHSLRKSQID